MAEFSIYDPLINPDPFASGFLGYGQLPLTPIYFIPFPPSSLTDLLAPGAAVFEVEPLALITSSSGVSLNTSGLAYDISPGYSPLLYLQNGGGSPAIENGVTLTLTDNEGYAGFTNYDIAIDLGNLTGNLVPINGSFPSLDADAGFVLTFDLAITEEQSNSNRAGFSLVLITEDLLGVEIGFKEEGDNSDRVFIQTADFTEGTSSTVPLEISDINEYQLTVQGGTYVLTANGVELLTGTLVDYNFDPSNSDPPLPDSINPYETPNFLFLGDNTDQGYANFTLGEVLITTPSAAPSAANADFNGDGQPDFFWQNSQTGQIYIWLMNGTALGQVVELGTVSPDWQMVGTGDFNQDSQSDLVWRNQLNGANLVWLMDGVTPTGFVELPTVGTEWELQQVGDFDQDGNPDLFWRNTVNNQTGVWLMEGTTPTGYLDLGVVAGAWTIAGVADFDQNGETDLLWRNQTSGENLFWLFDGLGGIAIESLFTVSGAWEIAGVADINQDSSTDILWRNPTTGENLAWYLDGTTFQALESTLAVPGASWELTV